MSGGITVSLGFEVGSGAPVLLNCRHMAVVGQTQDSGKTTTLEALIARAGVTALAFITKRGERSFESGRRIAPYFHDRADWQFVDELLEAVLEEKNKFLRPWVMKICRDTRTLADVHRAVREKLLTAKGINEGVYTQLDAYLQMIVPEIARARLAPTLDLKPGLNIMDLGEFATPMQMLFVQSALDWINEKCTDTVTVIPEAWEFVPQGKGSPVKKAATTMIRKGAGIGNFVWLDSQDMAGVDKVIMRGCTTVLMGVQREANEIKRNIANIPAGIAKPKPGDLATLERGQFFACYGRVCAKTYVQPSWMDAKEATLIATGKISAPSRVHKLSPPKPQEPTVKESEAQELRDTNARQEKLIGDLRAQVANLNDLVRSLRGAPTPAPGPSRDTAPTQNAAPDTVDALFEALRERCQRDATLLRLVMQRPEIELSITRRVIQVDGTTSRGRIVALLASGFYDAGATNSGTRQELKRTGGDMNNGTISKVLTELLGDGFLTRDGDSFKAVPGMKVNIKQT